MNRGVLWIVWGDKVPPLLWRSMRSVAQTNPELGIALFVGGSASIDMPDDVGVNVFREFEPRYPDARCRAEELPSTQFGTTLMLDTDTVVLRDISYGFDMAERHGAACCIAPASDAATWHGMPDEYPRDLPQYNCGAMFVQGDGGRIVQRWRRCNERSDLSRFKGQDQPGFAAACHELGYRPYVLPPSWNYRPDFGQRSGFGPVRIWHSSSEPMGGIGDLPPEFWQIDPPKPMRWDVLTKWMDIWRDRPITGAEVGVYRGACSEQLLRRLPNLKLYMIDRWCDRTGYRESDQMVDVDDWDSVYAEAMKRTEFAMDRRWVMRGESVAMAEEVDHASLDFVFIDGDHRYEAVKRDLEAWWPALKVGGLMCGHDWGQPRIHGFGVEQAVREFGRKHGAKLVIADDRVWGFSKCA